MPYTGAGDPKLPENVQALPEARREQWVAVWNSVFEKCQKGGGDDCEAAAFRQANGVVFGKKSVENPPIETEKSNVQPPVEKSEDTEAPAAEPDRFFVYKQADGVYRWASISSVAVKDKEFEIVTEKAQADAIQHANDTSKFGGLDLVHVNGTDIGKCDFMTRAGKHLIESGTFDDTRLARGAIKAIQDDPDYWGVSIKFVYDPSKFDGEKYNGNIRIKARTILPQEMAASYGTKLVAIGGEKPMNKELSDQARDALRKLNVPEEDIEEFAEKQIEPEPNTVEKGDEAATEPEPETVEVEKTLWDRIKSAFSKPEPDAETGGEETAEVEPVAAQEETKEVDLPEVVKGLFDAYTGATVEAVQSALAQRDKQIAALGEAVLALNEQVKALQAPIEDAIEKRLAELPRVVKAAPSQTATTDQVPAGRVLPYQNQATTGDFVGELMKGVQGAVEQVARQFDQVQV